MFCRKTPGTNRRCYGSCSENYAFEPEDRTIKGPKMYRVIPLMVEDTGVSDCGSNGKLHTCESRNGDSFDLPRRIKHSSGWRGWRSRISN